MIFQPPDRRQGRADTYNHDLDTQFLKNIQELIETHPLYKKKYMELPPLKPQFRVDVANIHCFTCRGTQPYRKFVAESNRISSPSDPVKDKRRSYDHFLETGPANFELICQGCQKSMLFCWVWVNRDWENPAKSYVEKVGQTPMWLPQIPIEIRRELGTDTELYQKALMNMNFSYGIGACSYLRRLLESHINPLLTLLLELRQEEGAKDDELSSIEEAIRAKDFTKKSKFAADICPPSLMAGGFNPLKKLHDLLSDSLHNLHEDEAMNAALQIEKNLIFVIRRLRSRYNEQREYVAAMRELNKPNP